MNIINLTPHAINICNASGTTIKTVEPSGQIARVSETREYLQSIDGIPVSRATYGKPENLPEPQEDTIYIVSGLMLANVPGRNDVYAPGPAVRDENGRIIGCTGLSAAPEQPSHDISFSVYDGHNATDIAKDFDKQGVIYDSDRYMNFTIKGIVPPSKDEVYISPAAKKLVNAAIGNIVSAYRGSGFVPSPTEYILDGIEPNLRNLSDFQMPEVETARQVKALLD